MNLRTILLFLAALGLSGCGGPREIYYWGNYEPAMYATFSKPGTLSPEQHIELLKADLTRAAARNQQPAPGLHAQLGYLYAQLGNIDAAVHEFEAEKALFPESAVLMDRMISKLKGTS